MKKLKKLICVLFASIMAFTSFVACKDDENSSSSSSSGEETKVEYTDYDLLKNGLSEYKIVESEEALPKARLASDELNFFFSEATGLRLPSVKESEVEYSDNAKLIILGDTRFTEKTGETVSEIPTHGFTLKTVGSNLFILGENHGVLYGVYEFLHQTFGYEYYAPTEIALAKNVTDMKLQKFDFTDAPDFGSRDAGVAVSRSSTNIDRYRADGQVWISERGNTIHNTFDEYFPLGTYLNDYPEFYDDAENPRQLCYTAHGDAEKMQQMQDIVVERMQYLVNKFYNQKDFRSRISFTHQDNTAWCECEACAKYAGLYGAQSASLVQFINPVAKRMREWMEVTWPGRELTIAIFAYTKTEYAPVTKVGDKYMALRKLTEEEIGMISNETLNGQKVYTLEGKNAGKFVEDDFMHLEENVAVWYAPIDANFYYDFDASQNLEYKETLEKWLLVADKLFLWIYTTNFARYLVWYDSFNSMQALYQMARDYNTIHFFDQGTYTGGSVTSFDMLKAYLSSKLMWNVDDNFAKLIDDFFANYFKDAVVPMRAYFNSYRAWMDYAKKNTYIPSQVLSNAWEPEYFPKQILLEWEGYIQDAYEAIEPLKYTDRVLYDELYNRIEKEAIAIRFNLYDLHGNTYPQSEILELRRQFKADAIRLGFNNYGETKSLVAYIEENWGV